MVKLKLSCRGLSKQYVLDQGYLLRAVDDCTLEINGGELVCIRGGSGSGKTSLIRLLSLMSEPDKGSIRLDGRELVGLTDSEAAKIRSREIGYIPQTFELVPILSALENIELPLTIHGRNPNRAKTIELAKRLGIYNCLSQLPGRLSGGQRQRIAAARAFVQTPGIILADEPTSNLDDTNMKHVAELFREFCADGGGLLVVTHDARMLEYADRVFEMENGKLKFSR